MTLELRLCTARSVSFIFKTGFTALISRPSAKYRLYASVNCAADQCLPDAAKELTRKRESLILSERSDGLSFWIKTIRATPRAQALCHGRTAVQDGNYHNSKIVSNA